MTYDDLCDRVNELVKEMLEDATKATPSVFGLDKRVASYLWLAPEHDAIIVRKCDALTLHHYSGFEFVSPAYRIEVGGYVVYSCKDRQVQYHINRALDVEEEGPELTPEDIAASKADHDNDIKKCYGK